MMVVFFSLSLWITKTMSSLSCLFFKNLFNWPFIPKLMVFYFFGHHVTPTNPKRKEIMSS
jgi:hypothetical protein